MIRQLGWDRALGLTLETFPADRLVINPDCGLRHLADVARAKLVAMVEGALAIRRTLPAASGQEPTVEQGA
jgi:5-methyltetrahydropteroyltriglutamate--homocysteine methyltransferase